MAHPHARLPDCANCHYHFLPGQPDEFCPRCGQQNQDLNLSFGHVAEEFLEGIFHFDGKVFRTARLLLFVPGELTRRFLAGHRAPYVPPVRLYVFISFIFFLLLSLSAGRVTEEGQGGLIKINLNDTPKAAPSAPDAQDTTKPTFENSRAGMAEVKAKQRAADSVAGKPLAAPGTAKPALAITGYVSILGLKLPKAALNNLPDHPTSAQLDSILRRHQARPSYLNRKILTRAARWEGASADDITHQVVRGFSLLMFLLMPLAALLLKGAYVRRSKFYLNHLIFTIHLHCFAFLVLGLFMALKPLHLPGWLRDWLPLLIAPYFLLALRRVYAQGWGKTLAKALLLTVAYALVFLFSVIIISFVGAFIF